MLAYVLQPRAGMNVNRATLDAKAMGAYDENAGELTGGATVEFLMKLIPTTVVDAFAKGDVLQVPLFALLFGSALALIGARGKAVAAFVDDLSHVLFKTMGLIIRPAPLGILGAISRKGWYVVEPSLAQAHDRYSCRRAVSSRCARCGST